MNMPASFEREYFEKFRGLSPEKREFVLELMRMNLKGELSKERLDQLIAEVKQGKNIDDIRKSL